MARASLEYSFLPGQSLWANFDKGQKVTACTRDAAKTQPSASCEQVLSRDHKARAQWQLERAFAEFESRF
jgi:hypothetical protein